MVEFPVEALREIARTELRIHRVRGLPCLFIYLFDCFCFSFPLNHLSISAPSWSNRTVVMGFGEQLDYHAVEEVFVRHGFILVVFLVDDEGVVSDHAE